MSAQRAAAIALAVASAFSSIPSAFYQQVAPVMGSLTLTAALLFAVHGIAAVIAMSALAAWRGELAARPVLVVALAVDAASAALLAVAAGPHEFMLLLLGRALTGFALGIITVTATSALLALPRGSALATACIMGGVGLGAITSGVISAAGLGRSAVFAIGIVLLLGAALVVLVAPSPTTPVTVVTPGGARPDARVLGAVALAFVANGILGLFSSVVPAAVASQSQGAPIVAGAVAGTALLAAGLGRLAIASASSRVAGVCAAVLLVAGIPLCGLGSVASSLPMIIGGGILLGAAAGIGYAVAVSVAGRSRPEVRLRMLAHVQRGGQLGLVVPVLLFPLVAQR